MKILLASSPIIGHVNPIIVAARVLKNAGHDVAIYTGHLFREKIELAEIQFFPLPEDVDFDMRDIGATFPEWPKLNGLPQLRYGMKEALVESFLFFWARRPCVRHAPTWGSAHRNCREKTERRGVQDCRPLQVLRRLKNMRQLRRTSTRS